MRMLYCQDTEGCDQETVIFKEIELIRGRLTAELPSQLLPAGESVREMFYPYEKYPETILADIEGKNQITIQMLNKELTPKETGNAAEAVREYAEKLYPHKKLSPVHLFREGEVHAGWFVMELLLGGQPYLHVKAVFSVNKQLCLTTITYPQQEQLKWSILLKHFLGSLHVKGEFDETNR